jgi:flagellar FliL protein
MVPMRERIVNLSDPGILRYLKTSIVLEVYDPENPTGHSKGEEKKHGGKEELPKDLKHKAAPIEDRVNAILSAKLASDIMGPAGRNRLKEEIRDEINHLLHEERILAVYFTDFIIQ